MNLFRLEGVLEGFAAMVGYIRGAIVCHTLVVAFCIFHDALLFFDFANKETCIFYGFCCLLPNNIPHILFVHPLFRFRIIFWSLMAAKNTMTKYEARMHLSFRPQVIQFPPLFPSDVTHYPVSLFKLV